MTEEAVKYASPRKIGDMSIRRMGDEVIVSMEFVFARNDLLLVDPGDHDIKPCWEHTFYDTANRVFCVVRAKMKELGDDD